MMLPPKYTESGPFADLWRAFNVQRAYMDSITLRPGLNTRIARTSGGTRVEGLARAGTHETTNADIFLAQVDLIATDFLTCSRFGGEFTGQNITVAKPPNLRSASDVRNIVIGGGSIDEHIEPAWAFNGIIAVARVAPGCGEDPPLSDGTALIQYADLNWEARHWKCDYVEVEVCVGGVTKHMIVAGGSPY